jgi:hypothetical protein
MPQQSSGRSSAMTPEAASYMGRIIAQEISNQIISLGQTDKLPGIPITKAFTGLTVNIGTTPTLVVTPDSRKTYLILNPALAITSATTDESIILASTLLSATTATDPINVAGVEDVHIHFGFEGLSGSWSCYLQVKDPITGTYANAQKIFDTDDPEVTIAGGPFYAYVGSLGIASTIRFNFVLDSGPGGMNVNLSITRKKNVGSLDITEGVPLTIFFGNSGVTTSSGYPLLEGEERFFVIDQNVSLYGIAEAAVALKLFLLEV